MSLPDPDAVARFLRATPDFLARNPELYRELVPPERPHGEAMADHMASMLSRARSDAASARAQAKTLLDRERGGADLVVRVHACVLALLGEDHQGCPTLASRVKPASVASVEANGWHIVADPGPIARVLHEKYGIPRSRADR